MLGTKFFEGFEKEAGVGAAAADLAGLYTLARPSIARRRGKPMSAKEEDLHELAGLGILGGHGAYEIGKAVLSKVKK